MQGKGRQRHWVVGKRIAAGRDGLRIEVVYVVAKKIIDLGNNFESKIKISYIGLVINPN